jgi:class 3 adenylate cyclase
VSVKRPSGTVTFLFTGIQDSPELWESRPVDMAAALPVHDAIVREAIGRHDGYVFDTGGDGFCAAFSTAASAVAAAVESQRELGAEEAVPFAVRMGLHTGEAIERGRRYVGTEVNRTARLMALGHGGQVLVSDTVELLLRSRLNLRPLGEHLLGGPRGRMAVFQVVAVPGAAQCRVLRRQPATSGHLVRGARGADR